LESRYRNVTWPSVRARILRLLMATRKRYGARDRQGRLAAADRNDVHDPVLLPNILGNLSEQTGLLEQVPELGTEDRGQGFLRQEVVVSRRSPPLAVRVQPTSGDQGVHMRVVAQVSRPAMQDADQAKGATDVFGIGSQPLQGLLGGLEEQIVDDLLVGTGQTSHAVRYGEGGQEVRDGQEPGSLLLEPAIGLAILTLGAVAVFTGVLLVVLRLTRGATGPDDRPRSPCDSRRYPGWPAGGWAVADRGMWRDSPGHAGGGCPPAPAWVGYSAAMSRLMISVAGLRAGSVSCV